MPQEDELDVYQRRVRDLTAEVTRLRGALAAEREAHRIAVRRGEVERDEGISPELVVLRRQVRHWRDRALAAEGRLTEHARRHDARQEGSGRR